MAQQPKIDKRVPMTSRRGRKLLYSFDAMKVGDSFSRPYTAERFNSIKTAAYGYGARHGMKFRASSRVEKGKRVIRIWRVQ